MQDKGAFYLKTEYIRAILERLLPGCDARDAVVGTAYGYMLYCNAVASQIYKQNAKAADKAEKVANDIERVKNRTVEESEVRNKGGTSTGTV